jgi:hypothetical protein
LRSVGLLNKSKKGIVFESSMLRQYNNTYIFGLDSKTFGSAGAPRLVP